MSIFNFQRRKKLLTTYLKTLIDTEIVDRKIIIRKEKLIFQFHMFQTNIQVYLSECFKCPLDCNKFLEFYQGKAQFQDENITELKKEDLLLLAHIRDIIEGIFPLESENIQNLLLNKIFVMKFGLIGFDQVGKTTLFELIPGKASKISGLLNSYKKEIITFLPLKINLYDYGKDVMENLASISPAPLLSEKLRSFYLYFIVTDSTPQNVTTTKQKLLPKLKRLSPFAAIVVLANKQDLSKRLSAQLIENIFGERTYPLTAINPESEDYFIKLLNEIILLRREQMQEYKCPFLEPDTSQVNNGGNC